MRYDHQVNITHVAITLYVVFGHVDLPLVAVVLPVADSAWLAASVVRVFLSFPHVMLVQHHEGTIRLVRRSSMELDYP